MATARTLFDRRGNRWRFDQELGGGGEGAVYSIVDQPRLVAKVYHEAPSRGTADKLQAMLPLGTDELRRQAAWPIATLHEWAGGPLVGFLMPRFSDARPIQNLYSPAQRKKWFPRADWGFILQAAISCAAAVAAVHDCGCVVGDINQGNMLVTPRGDVPLIDCDSFQIPSPEGLYRCTVGVDLFTPPELQGISFADVTRTVNHDAFALAVVLFHLLFGGRHPYTGIVDGDEVAETVDLIGQYRFAYSRSAHSLRISPPPHTPSLDLVGAEVAGMFERTFLAGSERPGQRPSARQWAIALQQLHQSLRSCPKDDGHTFPGHLVHCPWCEIREHGGIDVFEGVAAAGKVFEFDQTSLQTFTIRFQNVAEYDYTHSLPAQPPDPPPIEPEPLTEQVQTLITLSRLTGIVALLGPLLMLVGCFSRALFLIGIAILAVFGSLWAGLRFFSPVSQERRRRKQNLNEIRDNLNTRTDEIEHLLKSAHRQHDRLRAEIDRLRSDWAQLPARCREEGARLERDRHRLAQEQFLKNYFLAEHTIPRIGPARFQVLTSFGVETAFDIDARRILAIKGFGPKLTDTLVQWRQQILAEFRFDPAMEVPREARERVALTLLQHQDSTRIKFRTALEQLETGLQRLSQDVHPLNREIEKLLDALAQSEADLRLITPV